MTQSPQIAPQDDHHDQETGDAGQRVLTLWDGATLTTAHADGAQIALVQSGARTPETRPRLVLTYAEMDALAAVWQRFRASTEALVILPPTAEPAESE